MDDRELDAFLTRQLADSTIPDGGFTHVIQRRVRRHRQRRRAILAGAVGLATALVGALAGNTGLSMLSLVSPSAVVSLIVLTAACGLVWIATESRGEALGRLG
ncbi:MAG: hypothetical protein ACRD3G_24145 [Vicinamibacterales bacterium]